MAISIESSGRRHYLVGDTYAIKDALRAAGAHWDGDRRAWWTSKRDVAERFVANGVESVSASDRQSESLADDTRIVGRAIYKGRSYILVWAGDTRRGRACKLAFQDGTRIFWVAADVQIVKRYEDREYRGYIEVMTFGRLKRLRAEFAVSKRTGIDTSYRAYQESIDAEEDMDNFDESARLERIGYAEWKHEVSKAG